MTTDEASKILNCSKNPIREELLSKFENLFKLNDRKTGGSFYLQSKVVRARETLELKLKLKENQNQSQKDFNNPVDKGQGQ